MRRWLVSGTATVSPAPCRRARAERVVVTWKAGGRVTGDADGRNDCMGVKSRMGGGEPGLPAEGRARAWRGELLSHSCRQLGAGAAPASTRGPQQPSDPTAPVSPQGGQAAHYVSREGRRTKSVCALG